MLAYFELDPESLGQMPTRPHASDAGWDLYVSRDTPVPPQTLEMVHTDIRIALPEGHFGLLLGRSSVMRVRSIQVIPSVIDQGYRGEILVQAFNMGTHAQNIRVEERIAQLIILPVPSVEWVKVQRLSESSRGEHGFGSSGV